MLLLALLVSVVVNATEIHKPGYCAMYGVGGQESFVDLPAPNNIKAQPLGPDDRAVLVSMCGPQWNQSLACCSGDQLAQMQTNFERIRPLISSCPACSDNFFQLFCHLSCSADQSTFLNVTKVGTATNGNDVVDELDFYVGEQFASTFYDSCKGIKFGATNSYAMDLIGGGATNYRDFFKFLGDKKPMLGGSPFQMNFKYDSKLVPFNDKAHTCDDPDFRCSCTDCSKSCPVLPDLKPNHQCTVGKLPCFSFSVLSIYVGVIAAYFIVIQMIRCKQVKLTRASSLLTNDSSDAEDALHEAEETYGDDINGDIIAEQIEEDDASLADDTSGYDNYKANDSYAVNDLLEKLFYRQGCFCALNPWKVIGSTLLIALVLCGFTAKLQLEKDPVHLWVSTGANAYKQKEVFDSSFGPFYRTEQIFVSNTTGDSVFQDFEFVNWWFEKENDIQAIQAGNRTLSDICFNPTGDACVIESFTQYFGGNAGLLLPQNFRSKIESCAEQPVNCLPPFQQPLKRSLLFGGDNGKAIESPALVSTFIVNNADNGAEVWEAALETYLDNITAEAQQWGVSLTYSTEGSIEKELNKSTNTDVRIVIISYLVMFAYVSFALGTGGGSISKSHSAGPTTFKDTIQGLLGKTRFGLGLVGIIIVLISVFASAGLCSIFNLKSTLIIAEVIPFLVLAVGVDNIFLLCNELQDINYLNVTNELPRHERIGKTLANVGPSILLSSSSEFACFLLASAVSMPAVRNFAVYSSLAILFNTLLQMTTFIAALSLDQQRLEEGRLDLLPWIKVKSGVISLPEDSEAPDSGDVSQLLGETTAAEDGFFGSFISKKLAPILFHTDVRKTVLLVYALAFGIALTLFPEVETGLDQRLALPEDSHLVNYYNDVMTYLNVGPPIYWVVNDIDVTNRTVQRQLCAKFTTCQELSLVNLLEQEYKRANVSTIAEPVASWLDDFLLWTDPDFSDCCRLKVNVFDGPEFCTTQPPRQCKPCFADRPWSFSMDGFPEGPEFMKFFNQWIQSPSDACPLAGKAPYSSSVYVKNGTIVRSSFRNAHTPLRTQSDFINAYHESLRITKEINKTGLDVFAYSPFYIFFVQYESIIPLTLSLIAIGLVIVFALASFILGSFVNAGILVLNVTLIMVGMGGAMALTDVSLNAVSLVNLMICLGLAVEFSVHMVRHFNFNSRYEVPEKSRYLSRKMGRAYNSLLFIGNTTLSGITMTKLIGIAVLGFTRSKIFQVYYFRMWLSLIVIASLHALTLLPILLGYAGSSRSYKVSSYATINNEDVLRRLREN